MSYPVQESTAAPVLWGTLGRSVKPMSTIAPIVPARMERLAPTGLIRTPASALQGGRETTAMKTSSIVLRACVILAAAKRALILTPAIVPTQASQELTVRFRTPPPRRPVPAPCHLLNPARPTTAIPIRVRMEAFAWTWRMTFCAAVRLVGVGRIAASILMIATPILA